jgi:thiol-disulfide isomerase/thioredoxin
MQPTVRELKDAYGERVDFERIDIYDADGEKLARKYNVLGTPTFILLDGDGEIYLSRVGGRTKEQLTKDLNDLLQP